MQQPKASASLKSKINITQWLQNTTNKARFQAIYVAGILLLLAFINSLQASPLQCQLRKNATQTMPKNSQTTTNALELITKSINDLANPRKSNAEPINLKEIAKIDSALSTLYLLQLFSVSSATIDKNDDMYEIICPACKQFLQDNFSFVSQILPSTQEQKDIAINITNNDIKALLGLDLAARAGEELLCLGLEKKDTKILLESYANLALAGANARAVNVLLSAVSMGDKDGATILGFLLDNGIYLKPSKVASQMVIKAINSGNLSSIFANPTIKQNFVAREFDAYSNVLENIFYHKLITAGTILNQQDSRYENLGEKQKADILKYIAEQNQKVQSAKQAVIEKMDIEEKKQFNEALKFKQHLHNTDEYPFATVFVAK